MLESSFKYVDSYNNDIYVTFEYVTYSDMKYTVIYCSLRNTIYQYMDVNYIEVKRVYKRLLHEILTLGNIPNMEELGFIIQNEIPF